jgi:hypothetical protein
LLPHCFVLPEQDRKEIAAHYTASLKGRREAFGQYDAFIKEHNDRRVSLQNVVARSNNHTVFAISCENAMLEAHGH